jgi:Zn-dependent protease with chaperone function
MSTAATHTRAPSAPKRWRAWLFAVDNYFLGIFGGLILTWTGLFFTLWLVAFGALAGVLSGVIGGETSGIAQTFHIGAGVGFGAAVVGLFVGAFYGLMLPFLLLYEHPYTFAGDIFSGLGVGFVTLCLVVRFEHQLLLLRGYRELSRRERLLIDPMVDEILKRANISGARPAFYVSDSKKPGAWTHAKSIVLARGLFGSYDESESPPVPDIPRSALAAILAHEIAHWIRADGVGLRAVWACSWPIIALYNLAYIMREKRILVTLGWLILWPAWVSINLIIKPLISSDMRRAEYEADALAASLGDEYRAGLRIALDELEGWEPPRTGWEDVLHATHPPIELRQQQLEVRASHGTNVLGDHITAVSSLFGKLTIRDPAVVEASHRIIRAREEGNPELAKASKNEMDNAILDWLRRIETALKNGEKVDVDESLENIQERIAGLEAYPAPFTSMAEDAVPTEYSYLTSQAYGDLFIFDPIVIEAGRLLKIAREEGDSELVKIRERDSTAAILRWLRETETTLMRGEAIDADENLESIRTRIDEIEAQLARLGT